MIAAAHEHATAEAMEKRLATIRDIPLSTGYHQGGMCVMEAVSYVRGEQWTDRPHGLGRLAAFLRTINDNECDVEFREATLRPLIPILATAHVERAGERAAGLLLIDWIARKSIPRWLRSIGGDDIATRLEALPSADIMARKRSASKLVLEVESFVIDVGRTLGWEPAKYPSLYYGGVLAGQFSRSQLARRLDRARHKSRAASLRMDAAPTNKALLEDRVGLRALVLDMVKAATS